MPQSLYIQNIDSYREHFEAKTLKYAHFYQLNRRFNIGENISDNEMLHTYLFETALSNNQCDIIEIIQDKIRGKLKEKDCKKPLSQLVQMYQEQEDCSVTECLDEACEWEHEW